MAMSEATREGLRRHREMVKNGEIKKVSKNPVEKLETNPSSLRLAVNAMCYQCMGCLNTPSEIRDCTSTGCALYAVRPYQ